MPGSGRIQRASRACAARRERPVYGKLPSLPPGTASGWHPVRLRLNSNGFSQPQRIAVDAPAVSSEIVVGGICDSLSWKPGEIKLTDEGYVSCWVMGLPETAIARIHVSSWVKTGFGFFGSASPMRAGIRQINGAVESARAERPVPP